MLLPIVVAPPLAIIHLLVLACPCFCLVAVGVIVALVFAFNKRPK